MLSAFPPILTFKADIRDRPVRAKSSHSITSSASARIVWGNVKAAQLKAS
jgi:hypothetical protein